MSLPRYQKFVAAAVVGLLLQGCHSSFHAIVEESDARQRKTAGHACDPDSGVDVLSGSSPFNSACGHPSIHLQGPEASSILLNSQSELEDSKPAASSTFLNSQSESGSGFAVQPVPQVRRSRLRHGYNDRLALAQPSRALLEQNYEKQLTLVRSLRARLRRERQKNLPLERTLHVRLKPVRQEKPVAAARKKLCFDALHEVQTVEQGPVQCLTQFGDSALERESMEEKACRSQLLSQAFGAQEWEHYFGKVGAEPPLPADIVEILYSNCPFWPGNQVKDTHLLVLIPSTVNGVPFTLNLLGHLIQNPKRGGYKTQYRDYCCDVHQHFGNQSPRSPYWVLVTRNVLPDSRYKTCAQHEEFVAVQSRRTGAPYKIPRVLEISTAILSYYVRSGERLYTHEPRTYTRCQEMVPCFTDASIFVGGFSSGGLYISDDFVINVSYGVSSVLRF
jgi:hypothetical protein